MFVTRLLMLSLVPPLPWSADAYAFKLNPCLRVLTVTQDGPAQQPIRAFNPCTAAPETFQLTVHEHMTIASIEAYRQVDEWKVGLVYGGTIRKLNYMRDTNPWSKDGKSRHRTFALVYGTWWNDDPMMYLWGQGRDFRQGVWHLNRLFSSSTYKTYAGGVSGCAVPTEQHLARWSHFGPLQHLHFMTSLPSGSERLQGTIDKALIWMEFSYRVATGEIAPDAPLTAADESHLSLPSVAMNLCLSDAANVKVRSLFARQGKANANDLAYRNAITPDIALGSMLHILQDSFSPAHACRIEVEQNGKRVAALSNVFNYNEQDHKAHAALDVSPPWLVEFVRTGAHRYANDPITTGAWLIGAIDQKRPWNEVRSHLLETVFAKAVSPDDKVRCIGT